MTEKQKSEFQTPPFVCKYMAVMIPKDAYTILEPTPGLGNLVRAIEKEVGARDGWYTITAPDCFFGYPHQKYDCVVMNPPFSDKSAYNVPAGVKGMRLGYHILQECMKMSDHVIALVPWFTISDSDVRLRSLKRWGLRSVTALPRKTFEYVRIQTVVLELEKGYKGETIFKVLDTLEDEKQLSI